MQGKFDFWYDLFLMDRKNHKETVISEGVTLVKEDQCPSEIDGFVENNEREGSPMSSHYGRLETFSSTLLMLAGEKMPAWSGHPGLQKSISDTETVPDIF